MAGELLSAVKAGAYRHLTILAPGIAERARPGQFVTLAVGGPNGSTVLRRAFALYRGRAEGSFGGTVELVVAARGAGTQWLTELREHDPLDIVGPLGRGFRLPSQPVGAVLVGGGYGSAPLFDLAEALLARECRVGMVLGAADADRLFGVFRARRMPVELRVTTDDGSMGQRGRVTDVLGHVIAAVSADLVYACGPMPMLRAVTEGADAAGIETQVAVEESMACGIGICMTCVLPVIGSDGVTRMIRSCVDGPVFRGHALDWDGIGTIPPGTLGAPGEPTPTEQAEKTEVEAGSAPSEDDRDDAGAAADDSDDVGSNDGDDVDSR